MKIEVLRNAPPLEHSAILLTCIKCKMVLKTNFRSFGGWPFLLKNRPNKDVYDKWLLNED